MRQVIITAVGTVFYAVLMIFAERRKNDENILPVD